MYRVQSLIDRLVAVASVSLPVPRRVLQLLSQEDVDAGGSNRILVTADNISRVGPRLESQPGMACYSSINIGNYLVH